VWLAVDPLDMRAGFDTALARVVTVFGAAHPHHAYLFANRRANRLKALVHDRIGIWLAARRLNQGQFVWPHAGSEPKHQALTQEQLAGENSAGFLAHTANARRSPNTARAVSSFGRLHPVRCGATKPPLAQGESFDRQLTVDLAERVQPATNGRSIAFAGGHSNVRCALETSRCGHAMLEGRNGRRQGIPDVQKVTQR
jgi:transposase